MARTKQTARPSSVGRRVTTWTRFHLPRGEKWPTWSDPSLYPGHVHIGPLSAVQGWTRFQLGRNVEEPEQAAYIIDWVSIEDVQNFQSSAACADFLRNLPKEDNPGASVESGSALRRLVLEGDPSLPLPATSRFLILKDPSPIPRADLEGRVTMTSFSVPCQGDSAFYAYRDTLRLWFYNFIPRGSEFFNRTRGFSYQYACTWKQVITEDHWTQESFGELEPSRQEDEGRTIFCHFFLWPRKFNAAPEREEESAADPQAKESWLQAIERVMPPATSWKQERWEIERLPFFYPLEHYCDLEEALSMATRMVTAEEYCQLHGVRADDNSPQGYV